jgi:hypothetical protein
MEIYLLHFVPFSLTTPAVFVDRSSGTTILSLTVRLGVIWVSISIREANVLCTRGRPNGFHYSWDLKKDYAPWCQIAQIVTQIHHIF